MILTFWVTILTLSVTILTPAADGPDILSNDPDTSR